MDPNDRQVTATYRNGVFAGPHTTTRAEAIASWLGSRPTR